MSYSVKQSAYFVPFMVALAIHILVIGVLASVLSVPTLTLPPAAKSAAAQPGVIEAVSVNQAAVEQEMQKIAVEHLAQKQAQLTQQANLAAKQAALSKQQQRTRKTLAALKVERQSQQSELARLKQQRALFSRQLAQQDLQRKLAGEAKAQQSERAKELAGVVNKYKQLIRQQIYPNWPVLQKDRGLAVDLLINVSNSGTVLSVSVQRTSGSAAFDRSAVTAVYKSSPLPVPEEQDVFSLFKQFKLTMQPQNIVG
jgi:colicin import membrane protein